MTDNFKRQHDFDVLVMALQALCHRRQFTGTIEIAMKHGMNFHLSERPRKKTVEDMEKEIYKTDKQDKLDNV